MAVNLNRRRGAKKKKAMVPLGGISTIYDKRMTEKAAKMDVASVIVTICDGSSFDKLFRTLPQESEYGRVGVYLVNPGQILGFIQRALQNEIVDNFTETGSESRLAPKTRETLKRLKRDCDEAGPDAICFNFECCGGYSEAGFCKSNRAFKEVYLDLIAFLVKEFGCMTMFSDFSLKALIQDWDPIRFGANPFKQVGKFKTRFTLEFDPETLKDSPSAQLNTVGSLSEGGKAQLKAMEGTILFTLTEDADDVLNDTQDLRAKGGADPLSGEYMKPYELEVLSIATMVQDTNFTNNKINAIKADGNLVNCTVGAKNGLAGHVLLTFPPSESNMERFRVELKEQEIARQKAIEENKAMNLEDEEQVLPCRGMMLVSCGHWIELMKIDVNMNRLLDTVKNDWGEEAANYQQMNRELRLLAPAAQQAYSAAKAVEYVQSRPAAKYNRLLKRKKKNGY